MSSTLRRRGHHPEDRKSRTHVEVAQSDEDESNLAKPLLGEDSEPASPPIVTSRRFQEDGAVSTRSASSSSSSSNWGSTIKETAVSVACGFMDLLPAPIQLKFLPGPPAAHLRFLDGWNITEHIGDPYAKDHADHVAMLRKLWELSFIACQRTPPPVPHELKSEEWKQFGFQGIDPSTDFRGAGAFSLKNLVFLAQLHPALYYECVHRADYPFAVAGINITMILITLLQINKRQTCLATRQTGDRYSSAQARVNLARWIAEGRDRTAFLSIHEREEEATRVFHEIYRLGVALVHQEWLKSNRNLMAFNTILGEGTKKLVNAIKCCDTLQEAMSHLPVSLR